MKQRLNQADQSTAKSSDSKWQLAGELELTLDRDNHCPVNPWLQGILAPLHLHVDFVTRVIKSAEEAAGRVMQAEAARKSQHIHVLVYLPGDRALNGKNWGFFRIEKVETTPDDTNFLGHAIEFYFYVEA